MSDSRSPEARAASDYFSALPYEQRKALAPLLEDYRRMGIDEALYGLRSLTSRMSERSRQIRRDAA